MSFAPEKEEGASSLFEKEELASNEPEVHIASSFWQRMKGLLGVPQKPIMLMIIPCKSIHTFGMRYPINVAFFDKSGQIVAVETSLFPKKHRSCRNACGVLEMPAKFSAKRWFHVGDQIRLPLRQ